MKYIEVFEQPSPGRKTKKFQIYSKALSGPKNWGSTPALLGIVKWHPGWRRFAFFPQPHTLFEAHCLHDLGDFCADETLKRNALRTIERAREHV